MKCAAALLLLSAAHFAFSKPPAPKPLGAFQLLPPDYDVFAVAFSPDEHRIALAAGIPGARQNALLLVPLGSFGRLVRIQSKNAIVWGPEWSPNSDAVLVGELKGKDQPIGIAKLYSLHGRELWERPGPGLQIPLRGLRGPTGGVFGFLDGEHLLASPRQAPGKSSAFEILNRKGRVTDTWPVPKQWEVAAICPDRHLLAVFSNWEESKAIIIDSQSRKVLQTESIGTWLFGDGNRGGRNQVFFTESGRTLCAVGNAQQGRALNAECWDVDSGKMVARFQRFAGGVPAAASARASRMALTDIVPFPNRLNAIQSYGPRVVWDFRTGAQVAEWEAPGQIEAGGWVEPSAVALSDSGRYLAEGGAGFLRLFELP